MDENLHTREKPMEYFSPTPENIKQNIYSKNFYLFKKKKITNKYVILISIIITYSNHIL